MNTVRSLGRSKRGRFAAFAVVVATALFAHGRGASQPPPPPHIAYINMTASGDRVVLRGVKVVPGRLKTPRKVSVAPGDLYYRVLGPRGTLLHEGSTPDPLEIRVESTGTDGQLRMTRHRLDRVDFSIRIPFDPSARTVKVWKVPAGGFSAETTTNTVPPIGSFAIDVAE